MGLPASGSQGASTKRPTKRRVWAIGTVGLLAAGILVGGWLFFAGRQRSELDIYLRAAERLMHGDNFYRLDERAFSYPPLFALVFLPLALAPTVLQRGLWFLVNALVVAVLLLRLNRLLAPILAEGEERRATPRFKRWLFWGLTFALSARHMAAPFENQSHDLLVFLCSYLAIEAWCLGAARISGLWAGLGAALKATPLFFAPFFLWQRIWGAALVLTVAMAGFTLLPDALFPAAAGENWTASWYRTFLKDVSPGESPGLKNTWVSWSILNQSVTGTVHRLVTPAPKARIDFPNVYIVELSPVWRRVAILAGQVAVLVWLLWITRPGLMHGLAAARLPAADLTLHRLGQGSAVLMAMVLLSPTSIKTHFCVLLLPTAVCLAHVLYRRRDWLVWTALAVCLVLGTLTVKELLGTALGNRVLAYGSVTACTLALYVATGRILLQVRQMTVEPSPELVAVRLQAPVSQPEREQVATA